MELPELFTERVKRDLGEVQAQQLFDALDGESPISIRYNPFKNKKIPSQNSIAWSQWGRYLESRPSFTFDSDFHAGLYYVQEASSQFVGHILSSENIQGAKLLDMCAAPGGKSTLYSTLVGVDGVVVANDIDKGRVSVLADNIRKWGIGNVLVSCNSPRDIAAARGWFDVVAVDAPCSGEGMFRRGDTAREEWSENGVNLCAERQKDILNSAWEALRCGGVLIYSTCTFNHTENEDVLKWFNEEYGEDTLPYEDVELDENWGIVRAEVGAFQTFRFFPHLVKGEGLFVAVVRKGGQVGRKRATLKGRKKVMNELDRASIKECSRWVNEPERVRFSSIADRVYMHPAAAWSDIKSLCESLNIIYSGVAMGQLFKGKLKPDHPLALYYNLRRENISCVEVAEEEVLSYLRKNSTDPTPFNEGLNLVTARGAAIGFVKRIGKRVNNMYPASLRILK